jgi:uncharacterized membrane protein
LPLAFHQANRRSASRDRVTIVAVLIGFTVIAAATIAIGNWRKAARPETLAA